MENGVPTGIEAEPFLTKSKNGCFSFSVVGQDVEGTKEVANSQELPDKTPT